MKLRQIKTEYFKMHHRERSNIWATKSCYSFKMKKKELSYQVPEFSEPPQDYPRVILANDLD